MYKFFVGIIGLLMQTAVNADAFRFVEVMDKCDSLWREKNMTSSISMLGRWQERIRNMCPRDFFLRGEKNNLVVNTRPRQRHLGVLRINCAGFSAK